MYSEVKAMLKRNLKSKVRFLEAMVVIYLISGTIANSQGVEVLKGNGLEVFGDLERVEINEDIGGKAEKNVNIASGNGVVVVGSVVVGEVNGKISGQASERSYYSGNGMLSLKKIVIKGNNGEISGVVRSSNEESLLSGNGIVSSGSVGIFKNKGEIRGTIEGSASRVEDSGNGISASGNILIGVNKGTISGNGNLEGEDIQVRTTGNAVISNKNIGIYINNGVIGGDIIINGEGSSEEEVNISKAGNGIVTKRDLIIKENRGVIGGTAKVVGIEVVNRENIEFTKDIEYIGNGISTGTTLVRKNKGLIRGELTLEGGSVENICGGEYFGSDHIVYGAGNGIYSNRAKIDLNIGNIVGGVKATGSLINTIGDGIDYTDTISNLELKGVGNGISSIEGSQIAENLGVIEGQAMVEGGDVKVEDTGVNTFMHADTEIDGTGNGILGGVVIVESNKGDIFGSIKAKGGSSEFGGQEEYSEVTADLVVENSGNGIFSRESLSVVNTGRISGSSNIESGVIEINNEEVENDIEIKFVGNGIASKGYLEVINGGTIRGSVEIEEDYELRSSGNGVSGSRGNVLNVGVISGSKRAVDLESGSVLNCGVFVGSKEIEETVIYKNYGTEVRVENNKDGSYKVVDVIIDKKIEEVGFDIINADIIGGKDSYIVVDEDRNYRDTIINGVGAQNGTLTIDGSNVTLDSSIVNAYEKAISLVSGGSVVAKATFINGGGITGEDNVVVGDTSRNKISIGDETVVNGNIDMGGGDDLVEVSNSVVNGDIIGGDGRDKAVFEGMNIYNKVEGFEELNIEGDVTLFENASIENTSSGKLIISNEASLNLRVDTNEVDDKGKIIGHGLYNLDGKIYTELNKEPGFEGETDGGTLNLITYNLIGGEIIGMGSAILDENTYVRTDSLITKANIENSDIHLETGKDLDSIIVNFGSVDRNKELNNIYKSLISSGDSNIKALYPSVGGIEYRDNLIRNFSKTKEEAEVALIDILTDVYSRNPYGYIHDTAKQTSKAFLKEIDSLDTEIGVWNSSVGIIHTDGNYDMKEGHDVNVYGGYYKGEYGLNEKMSLGYSFGGANTKTNIVEGSKIEASSLLIGSYGSLKKNSIDLTLGVNLLGGSYDTTRVMNNKYQHHEFLESADVYSVDIYADISRDIEINEKIFANVAMGASYFTSWQEGVDEGSSNLAIETEKKRVESLDLYTKAGVEARVLKGKLKTNINLFATVIGEEEGQLKGSFKEGSDLDILIPASDDVRAGVEVLYTIGDIITYTLGGGYTTGSDSKEFYIGAQIGYKFK